MKNKKCRNTYLIEILSRNLDIPCKNLLLLDTNILHLENIQLETKLLPSKTQLSLL